MHAFQIAYAGRRADIDIGAVIAQVREHLCGSCRPVLRHIAPAAKAVVAIGELNRLRAIRPPRVDVRAAPQQQVDHVELACHGRPVDRLVAAFIAGVN